VIRCAFDHQRMVSAITDGDDSGSGAARGRRAQAGRQRKGQQALSATPLCMQLHCSSSCSWTLQEALDHHIGPPA